MADSDTPSEPHRLAGAVMETLLAATHLRRLKHYYRSAGWPVRDAIELDLLASALAELRCAPSGHESIYVTPQGIAALAQDLERHRRKRDGVVA